MKTPKHFQKYIQNGIITEEMLELALNSVNKRAKNCRDKIREYKSKGYYNHKDIETYELRKEEYYNEKDIMLKLLKPKCLHKVCYGMKRERIYDYEDEFESIKHQNVIYHNQYYDEVEKRIVKFVDIYTDERNEIFYLYYETSHYAFHLPIDEYDVHVYLKKYPLVDIQPFIVQADEIRDLVSAQFCKKLVALINSNQYQYIS